MSRVGAALVAIVTLAATASAAVSVASTSAVSAGVTTAAVRFEIGAAGAVTRYFSPFTLSANSTIVSGTVLGRAGADWTASDVLRVVNARAADQSVTLTATQLSNAQLDLFLWHVYDGATLIGTLDMEAASPSLTFTLPASTTYKLHLRLDLADGAGRDNAPSSFELRLALGSGITLTHTPSTPSLDVLTVEVPFGKLATGSSVGANATNASASIAAHVVIEGTDNAFYLNNTNASAAWWVKVVHTSSSGIAELSTTNIGVDNGTASVDHVKISSGALTQASGSYQRLEPASTNRIYVTTLESVLFAGATIDFDVYASDTSDGSSALLSKGRLTLT